MANFMTCHVTFYLSLLSPRRQHGVTSCAAERRLYHLDEFARPWDRVPHRVHDVCRAAAGHPGRLTCPGIRERLWLILLISGDTLKLDSLTLEVSRHRNSPPYRLRSPDCQLEMFSLQYSNHRDSPCRL